MLATNDVVDLVRKARVVFVDKAVLAAPARAPAYLRP